MGVKCPKCHFENPSDSKFCKECGTQIIPLKEVPVTETLETPTEELTRGTTFAGRYEIIEELGKGGMGKVYRVEDKKIKEEVALKLIKPEIASDKKTIDRFSNELKMARKIRHKNVCGMYDLGEEKGTHYITMEYVPGEDLKGMIRMMGQLGAGKSISIAKQVCEGLAEAHRLGVFHRDLKPSNIMIDREGNARIMDFGIARSVKGKGITGAGVMIGTPEYMSPEQAEVKEVDQRSDVYSLGVILYEMVTGRVPFEGETPLGIAMKHKSEMPKDPREINAQIPEDLSRVTLRCLEKNREKRYQSAGEVRSELENIEKGIPTTEKVVPKRKPITSREITVQFSVKKLFIPALVVVALVVLALVIWHPWSQKEAVLIPSDKPSIAVLSFDDLSPQKDQEYLCDGFADELINRLTKIESLRVPARTSSFSFKGKKFNIREIGNKLNVETVLEGSVRKARDKLRITVQLVKVVDGYPLWSEKYERNMEDVFALQDEISLAIVDNLKIKLLGEEKAKIVKHYTENLEAYNLYLQGRYFWDKRTEEDIRKAIKYFEQAIEIDPNYALAYVGLADSYSIIPDYCSFPSKKAYPKAKEATLRALEIDNTLAEAYTSLASIKDGFEWDWSGAERDYKRAIELNPGYATAHHWYAFYLMLMARFDEAIKEIKRAHELDPLSLVISRNFGRILYSSRQYDQAIEALQKTLEMDSNFSQVHLFLGKVYLQKSIYEEALTELKKERNLSRGWNSIIETWIGIAYSRIGNRREAQKLLDDMIERSKGVYISPSLLGRLYFALGKNDQGFKWLEKAYEERDRWLFYLKIDPVFDSVRSDPRFTALLKKIGLEK
jgi:serine/threonine protein kinase/tetratricopeptide (TPR) repeat protein